MAAFPGLTCKKARNHSMKEAVERYAVNQFNSKKLPVKEHPTIIKDLKHFEVVTNFNQFHVSILSYNNDGQYLYAFACDESLKKSFDHALVELARNIRVMKKLKDKEINLGDFGDYSDRRLIYYSTQEGFEKFNDLIKSAPLKVLKDPKLLCDLEIRGPWSKHTKVWRTLFEGSHHEDFNDHEFFMF
jgi:hypothetical protein